MQDPERHRPTGARRCCTAWRSVSGAQVVLDTGHLAPGTNIEFIVMQLLRAGRRGAFDFNSAPCGPGTPPGPASWRPRTATACRRPGSAASPAKSVTFAGATPSSQRAVSPSSSTSSRYSAWALNRDRVALLGPPLQPVEHRPAQAAVSSRPCAVALSRADPADDARADRLVDLGTDVRRHLVQRGVRREAPARPR